MPADNLPLAGNRDEAKAAAHTPGPWSFAPAVPGAKHCFYIAGNNDAHNRQVDIGTVEGGYYSCEANARLIAAAPDLLEALKWIERHYANQDISHVDFRVEAYARARAALSRAGSAQ